MRIVKNESLKVADKVVAAMKKDNLNTKSQIQEVYQSAWSNGREQGYMLEVFVHNSDLTFDGRASRAILVAQQRNSDGILIIADANQPFDYTTHQPSEVDFDAAVEFTPQGIDGAARHALEWLLNGYLT